MATTYYRVKSGDKVVGEAGTTKEVQGLLKAVAPGEYPIDVVRSDESQSPGSSRHWGKAIKHEDGMVHLESDQPGE